MSTYVPILDTQLDPDAPLTSTLMYQLRDNFLAAAESDATVPAVYQLGHTFLGTLTTTSGTTVTLSGLNLVKFKAIKFVLNGVGISSGSSPVSIGGAAAFSLTSNSDRAWGFVEIDLFNGTGFSAFSLNNSNPSGLTGNTNGLRTTLTTASTSVSAVTNGNPFAAGSIRVYGVQ
jgi:hypothetical protein